MRSNCSTATSSSPLAVSAVSPAASRACVLTIQESRYASKMGFGDGREDELRDSGMMGAGSEKRSVRRGVMKR